MKKKAIKQAEERLINLKVIPDIEKQAQIQKDFENMAASGFEIIDGQSASYMILRLKWYEKFINFFGIKSKRQIKCEEHNVNNMKGEFERIDKNKNIQEVYNKLYERAIKMGLSINKEDKLSDSICYFLDVIESLKNKK